MSDDKLIRPSQIAEMLNRTPSTISRWRKRYEDFPEPKLGEGTNATYYSQREIVNWYARHWPHKAARLPRWLHLFEVQTQKVAHRVLFSGPAPDVISYMRAYRDIKYDGWKVTTSSDGFVARKDGAIHVAALDTETPMEWFVYEQQILATGRREK